MESLVSYFARRSLAVNMILFGTILAAVFFWPRMGKEEMPDFELNFVRVSVVYPGASAYDVELAITRPIEEKLKGLTSLREVSSTSSFGAAQFSVIFDIDANLVESVQEVKDAVNSVDLPQDALDPVFRQWKSSEKAIINIGLYLKDAQILSVDERYELQKYALSFKDRLISLNEVSGVELRGFLRPELQVKVDTDKISDLEISLAEIRDQIVQQNVRMPVGSMTNRQETEISLSSELDNVQALEKVIVSMGFEGAKLELNEIAKVGRGFEKTTSVIKVQGHEGIVYNVQKSSSTDILKARSAILKFIERYERDNPDLPLGLVLIDDESVDVRNRLSLIGVNGVVGFFLIALVLFLFLDFRSGLWVAMGIPFTLSFTILVSHLLGLTVNNITLAAIIIVLGIVVDDAIIVAENITRKKERGLLADDAAESGTKEVMLPILASVLTTCAAFIPLAFFEGRFGMFVVYIPIVVSLMLFASLIESYFLLPSHMIHPVPGERFFKNLSAAKSFGNWRTKIVTSLESAYQKTLRKLLNYRSALLIFFCALAGLSYQVFVSNFNYVMFPREEVKRVNVRAVGPDGANRYEMARILRELEDVFLADMGNLVTSVESRIGQSRRGGQVMENEASVRVEIVSADEREITADELIERWQNQTKKLTSFQEIRFLKDRFGSGDGSPVVIEVQENDDAQRLKVAQRLRDLMNEQGLFSSVEIERPITKQEYQLELTPSEVSRLGINYAQLASTLRTYVQGSVLYTLIKGDEEVDVRLTSLKTSLDNLDDILSLKIQNQNNYLVPISTVVKVIDTEKPASINRTNFKRTVTIYADIAADKSITPLEVAELLENELFAQALKGSPTTLLKFRGEIEETRESQSDFMFSVILVLLLIYILLVFLFNSLFTPLLIAVVIPFGAIGVILSFYLHGFSVYGFFAVVGALGMLGIVVNDSIVLIDQYETKQDDTLSSRSDILDFVSQVSSTRLRAVMVTTLTTVAGLIPTAYGWGGYDSMLAEMMLAMAWGLSFGTFITLLLVPCLYSIKLEFQRWRRS